MYVAAPNKEINEGSDSVSDSDSGEEYEEEDGLIGKEPRPPLTLVSYDKEDPKMNLGIIYPNM